MSAGVCTVLNVLNSFWVTKAYLNASSNIILTIIVFKCLDHGIRKKVFTAYLRAGLNVQLLRFQVVKNLTFRTGCVMCVPEAGDLGRGLGRQTAEGGPINFWHHFRWVGVLFSGHYTRCTFKSTLSHLKFSQRLKLGLLLVLSLDAIFVFFFFLVFIVILVGNWKSLYLRHLPRQQFILLTFLKLVPIQ